MANVTSNRILLRVEILLVCVRVRTDPSCFWALDEELATIAGNA
jgi:hypothetical protein